MATTIEEFENFQDTRTRIKHEQQYLLQGIIERWLIGIETIKNITQGSHTLDTQKGVAKILNNATQTSQHGGEIAEQVTHTKTKTEQPENILEKNQTNPEYLAQIWAEFVGDRIAKGEGVFLNNLLRKYNINPGDKVFDAGAGCGLEAGFMHDLGYNVTANEIDPAFRKVMEDQFSRVGGTQFDVTTHNWEALAEKIKPQKLLLCLGNSITYALTEAQQLKVLENFRKSLTQEGFLLVDERNYDRITKHIKELQKEENRFPNPEEFAQYNKPMYCGTTMEGYPVHYNEALRIARFKYEEKIRDTVNEHKKKALKVINKNSGALDMYAFQKGEMRQRLEAAGFEIKETWHDFKDKTKHPLEKTNFIQYLCQPKKLINIVQQPSNTNQK